jgi:hypothetical protein
MAFLVTGAATDDPTAIGTYAAADPAARRHRAHGISTPPLMIVVMRITNDREVMGSCANASRMNALGWITVLIMLAALARLLFSLIAPIPGG